MKILYLKTVPLCKWSSTVWVSWQAHVKIGRRFRPCKMPCRAECSRPHFFQIQCRRCNAPRRGRFSTRTGSDDQIASADRRRRGWTSRTCPRSKRNTPKAWNGWNIWDKRINLLVEAPNSAGLTFLRAAIYKIVLQNFYF